MQNTINKCVNRRNACVHALYAPQWAQFDTASNSGDDDYINNNNKLTNVTHITVQKPQCKQIIE